MHFSEERHPLQTHVCRMFVVVVQGIIRDGTNSLVEDRRVLKILAR